MDKTIKKEVSVVIKQIGTKITDLSEAVEQLTNANRVLDKLTEEKEKVTRPLNEALRAERARWKPLEDELKESISTLRYGISRFQTELIAKQKVKEEKIAEKVLAGSMNTEKAIVKMDSLKVSNKVGQVSFKTVKKFKVMDVTMLPHEYVLPNEIMIREAMNKGLELAGVDYFTEQLPVNRRF